LAFRDLVEDLLLTLSALGALLGIVLMVVGAVLARPLARVDLHARSTVTGGSH
jgi:hypothetical protein